MVITGVFIELFPSNKGISEMVKVNRNVILFNVHKEKVVVKLTKAD